VREAAHRRLTEPARFAVVGTASSPVSTGVLFLVSCLSALGACCYLALRLLGQSRLWVPAVLILTAPLEVYLVNVGPFNLSLFRVALGVSVGVTVVDVWRRRPHGLAVPATFIPYALLVALQLVSVAFVTPARSLGVKFLSEYLAGLVAAGMIVWFGRGASLKALLALFGLSAVLPELAAIWRTIFTPFGHQRPLPGLSLLPVSPVLAATRNAGSYLTNGVKRMEGSFGDPNHFGFFLGLVLILCVAGLLWQLGQRPHRPWLVLSLFESAAVAAVLLVGSDSRSAWLLAAIGVAGLLALWVRGRRHLLTWRRVATVVAVCAIGALIVGPVVLSRLNPASSATRVSNRIHEQTATLALDLLRSHPVSGVGLGAYGRYAGEPYPVSAAHSTVLTTGAELGVPGLLALLAAMGLTAIYAIRHVRRASADSDNVLVAGVAAGFVALALANLIYDVWTDDFQWIFFGLTVVATSPPSLRLWPFSARGSDPISESRVFPRARGAADDRRARVGS
jgi:hypothetical protein